MVLNAEADRCRSIAEMNGYCNMENELKRIISDLLGLKLEAINEDTSMQTVSEWDSLKHLALILSIEENFNVQPFSMDEIVEMTSFLKIMEVLGNKGLA